MCKQRIPDKAGIVHGIPMQHSESVVRAAGGSVGMMNMQQQAGGVQTQDNSNINVAVSQSSVGQDIIC